MNRLTSSPHQRLVAIVALTGALLGTPFLFDANPLLAAVSLLFATKVILAFAVDHTAARRHVEMA